MKFALLFQILLVGSLLALTVPANIFHVSALPSYAPGVKSGDTVSYGNVTGFWQSNGTQAQPPPLIAQFMHVQSVHVAVQSVSGSNINASQTFTFTNGTNPRNFFLSGNVATGSGNLTFWILASGLTAGDPIYNAPSPTINRTDTEFFGGALRQVIRLTFVANGGNIYQNWAWDQATGVLVSFETNLFLQTGSISFSGYANATITSTSLWSSTLTPNFSISANPNVLTVFINNSFLYGSTITLTSQNFVGPVQLTAHVNPSGLAVALGLPTLLLSLNGQNATTLTPVASTSTSPGTYQVTVIGTAGSISQTSIMTIIVPNTVGDFRITANPASITIHKAPFYDPFASSTISLTSLSGFSGNLFLSAVEVPGSFGGFGLSFNPSLVSLIPNATANSTLTVSAPNTAPGTYLVNVTATKFFNTTLPLPVHHSVTITIHVVTPPPDFQIYLSVPFGGNLVVAGATTFVGVQISSNGSGFFNGTVTLTGQVHPLVNHGPTLSFNPTQLSLTFPGTPFSQMTISTTALTPPGNYTITIIGTSGALVHTAQFQLVVLPPPILTISPSSGPVGTLVTVHGSGFLNLPQGPYSFPVEIQMTFDDQLIGFFYIQGSSFNFTFNVPDAQAGIIHMIHAKELYPSNLDVQASFLVLPEPSALTVTVSSGTIYFPGDTATIFAMTGLSGQSATVTSLQVVLVRPNGSNITLTAVFVSPGVYKATFLVPTTGSIGTYAVIVKAHQAGSADASALASFEVKPTWLQSNGRTVVTATSLVGAVGALGVVALAWRKGYFTRRTDEFPIP